MQKKIILILLLLVTGFAAKSQIDSTPVQYRLKGKIINNIQYCGCGNKLCAIVVELEIIAFSDTSYKQKTIAIIERCPDLAGPNFLEKGKVYELIVFYSDKESGYSISNEIALDKYPLKAKLWTQQVTKLD